eukprot:gb/GFBE01025530.1/.p1 GENE.gb/GFBE01025530.1/~~gb/GFBE01025530.1/.p1  ORF type:complete len:481 (+),score=89.60 gb/GFBE01025530.1/:1-1443(+)
MGGVILEDDVEEEQDGKRSLSQTVDELGIGWTQVITCFIGGAIWAADGAELLIIGSVSRAVSQEWGLEAWQRGALVSLVFIGVLLGNSASGPFGDGFGRRMPMLVSFVGIAIFSVLSTATTGFYTLAAVRMVVGASFGVGQPAYNTLLTELTPRKWRLVTNSVGQSMFTIGEIYAALLIWYNDPDMKDLDWRWLCVMGALPSVIGFALSYFLLHESPAYLSEKGYDEEAKQVLDKIRSANKAEHVSLDFTARKKKDATPTSSVDAVKIIYSPQFLYTTLTMMYSCFVLNLVYYGCLYAFPQVMQEVDMGYSAAIGLVVGALWELPGFALSSAVGIWMKPKNVVLLYLVTTAASLVSFTVGANREGLLGGTLLQGGYLGLKVMVLVGFVTVYQMATEVYPTSARNTGAGACFAGGRIGSILAPLVYEEVYERSGWKAYFWIMVCTMVVNVILIWPLHVKDKESKKEVNETTPLVEGGKSLA